MGTKRMKERTNELEPPNKLAGVEDKDVVVEKSS
jgi:hypothetical protein